MHSVSSDQLILFTITRFRHSDFFKSWISQGCKYEVCGSKGFKVTSCQSWRFQEKVYRPALAPLKPDLQLLQLVTLKPFELQTP